MLRSAPRGTIQTMQRVIMVHGLGSEPEIFDPVVERLTRRHPKLEITRVRVPDDFGVGVDAAARWMRAGPGVAVGHSMGGQVVLSAATRAATPAHRLLLLAPGGVGPRPLEDMVWAIYSAAVLRSRSAAAHARAIRVLFADAAHPAADALVDARRAQRASGEIDRWAERVESQCRGAMAAWPVDLTAVQAPVHIIRGRADPMVPAAQLRPAARHHHVDYTEWAGVGHMLPLEAPDAVTEAIATLIA